ncbi:MAG: hypothetical protein IJS28_00380 [Synergistaceae bacterium]|nr:hypothetical protein [Synergistaceae bacterium]
MGLNMQGLPEDVRREVEAAMRDRDDNARKSYEDALCEEVDGEVREYLKHGDSAESVALYAAIRFVSYMEKMPEYELAEIWLRRRHETAKHA